MAKTDELEQRELEKLNEEQKLMELDQLITEGTDARIPFEFKYPNSNKRVGVLVRPLSTNEYQSAIMKSRKFKSNFLTELAKIGVYKMNGDDFPPELFDELPAGVVTILTNEINRISGVELVEGSDELNQTLIDDLMGF